MFYVVVSMLGFKIKEWKGEAALHPLSRYPNGASLVTSAQSLLSLITYLLFCDERQLMSCKISAVSLLTVYPNSTIEHGI